MYHAHRKRTVYGSAHCLRHGYFWGDGEKVIVRHCVFLRFFFTFFLCLPTLTRLISEFGTRMMKTRLVAKEIPGTCLMIVALFQSKASALSRKNFHR